MYILIFLRKYGQPVSTLLVGAEEHTSTKWEIVGYEYMQNDVLATGIMSFVMHEMVYFGRSLPWIIIDAIPYFRKWKIQNARNSRPNLKYSFTNTS